MLSFPSNPSNSSPPTPCFILRLHSSPISSLHFSNSNKHLYSGDTSGFIAQWNLKTYRAEKFWKAHEDGILSIREIITRDGRIRLLTHARDNHIHLFHLPPLLSSRSLLEAPSPASPSPNLDPIWSIQVNALNFCQLSLLLLPTPTPSTLLEKGKVRASEEEEEEEEVGFEALVAVPSLTKDEFVDVFHIPSKKRIHRSIGIDQLSISSENKTGSVMALHLFLLPSLSTPTPQLHLLIGFESGLLTLLKFTQTSSFHLSPTSSCTYFPLEGKMVSESEGWELVWMEKSHRDAIMSIDASHDQRFVVSVGADHRVSKYRIFDINEEESKLERVHTETSDSPGKSIVRIRGGDSKILATAGWDGEARVYSFKSLKPLAVLSHHRGSLQALDFANVALHSRRTIRGKEGNEVREEENGNENEEDEEEGESESDEDEGMTVGERGLLATGGQDMKVCLWEIYPPANS